MKVLFVNRKDAFSIYGGDTVQMVETQKKLISRGLSVDIALGEQNKEIYRKYDIVHIFNVQTDKFTLGEALKVKMLNKPLVISPIWWDFDNIMTENVEEMSLKSKMTYRILGKKVYMVLKNIKRKRRYSRIRKILDLSNIILPNSYLEIESLIRSFGDIPLNKINVVYNGISEEFIKQYNNKNFGTDKLWPFYSKDYVIQVGRIDKAKNTLLTIKACSELNIPLVLVGLESNDYYSKLCRNEATGKDVYFLGQRNIDELIPLYKKAKVHILPSFRETPGLVNLEAAAFGCNIVTTNIGSAKEYFKEKAFYCSPLDYEDIKRQIELAWLQEKNEKLPGYVMNNFTWEIAAKQTLESYKKI